MIRRRFIGAIFTGALFTVTALGCGVPFGVRRTSPEVVHRALTSSVLSTGKPSGFSEITLRRRNLVERFDDAPEAALAALRAYVIHDADDTEDLFALAELSFFHAGRSKQKPYFLATAIYAYAYLFPAEKTHEPDPFDPRFRLACDLYNRALTEAFKSANGTRVVLAGGAQLRLVEVDGHCSKRQHVRAMPSTLLAGATDLFSRNEVKPYLKQQRVPTSIDNMSPTHPFIRAISEIPLAPGIAAHSIIGVTGNGPIEDGGDGVVKYRSAHIDGVESELVVDSPHSMQSHPAVVNEVQRILHLHADRNPCAQ